MKGKLTLAAALALIGASGWWLANACAPDFMIAVFSYKRHPDLPRSEFIDGRLGVLQPTFARSYLVIADRYLNGIGMSAGERQQARDYYKDRLTGSWDHSGTDWPARWREVRSRIASPPPPKVLLITNGQLAYDPETHSFALNCAEDGYRIAIQTLSARRRQFGLASRAFRSWLSAQDKVFQNCEGGPAIIPPNASPGLPALVRADRDYQIAAANFYAGYYETALDQFRRIGRDTSSPWRIISRYLVVRTLLRLIDGQDTPDGKIGAQIRTEAQRILEDPKLIAIHAMTWNLVERAGLRERNREYFRELAHLLVSRDQDDGLREALWNYTDMYDSIIGDADPNEIFHPSKPVAADPFLFRSDDLSDWVFCFQSRDASVFPHSLARWKQSRSPAWLLAALSHATAVEANREGLLAAVAAVTPTSPAYLGAAKQ